MPDTLDVTCRRDGSKWYACAGASDFAGCCKLDPCKYGCPDEYLGVAMVSSETYGKYPDLSCGVAADFYSCSSGLEVASQEFGFWGCCKTQACINRGCPASDLRTAYMNRDDLRAAYTSAREIETLGNNTVLDADQGTSAAPLTLWKDAQSSRRGDQALIGACLALLVALPIFLVIWICGRQLRHSKSETRGKTEEYVESRRMVAMISS
jgi:hypothetical protein